VPEVLRRLYSPSAMGIVVYRRLSRCRFRRIQHHHYCLYRRCLKTCPSYKHRPNTPRPTKMDLKYSSTVASDSQLGWQVGTSRAIRNLIGIRYEPCPCDDITTSPHGSGSHLSQIQSACLQSNVADPASCWTHRRSRIAASIFDRTSRPSGRKRWLYPDLPLM
jgi:hypothetical protein